jgi:TPR repeat protein
MAEYKSEIYKGEKIVFDVRHRADPNYKIGARTMHRHSQYLGMGRTKRQAFANLKKVADKIDRAGNWRRWR